MTLRDTWKPDWLLASGPRTPEDLPEDWRQLFEERWAIMQFDGHMAEDAAREAAFRDTLRRMRA